MPSRVLMRMLKCDQLTSRTHLLLKKCDEVPFRMLQCVRIYDKRKEENTLLQKNNGQNGNSKSADAGLP